MTHEFDARGMKCPLPVLKARKILKDLPEGTILEIRTTDPGAPSDFQHFCETTGHRLLGIEEGGQEALIRIESRKHA